MSELVSKVNQAMIDAMKTKQSDRLLVLRSLISESKGVAIKACRKDVTDEDTMTAILKGVKQREDSIEQFTTAGRLDLVTAESFQLSVLKEFLPEQLSESQVLEIITETVNSVVGDGVKSKKMMGAIMKELNPKLKGKADMKIVNQILATQLA